MAFFYRAQSGLMRLVIMSVSAFVVSACASVDNVATISHYPGDARLTIGVLADSQFQNRERWAVTNALRGPREDRLVNVAIRPPALVASARALLMAHLQQQQARGVTAIFYLGDGANHGCNSELFGDMGVFTVLEEFREDSRIPVFFIVGNHDFLAAGNSSRPDLLDSTCGTGNWPHKAVLINRIEAFNAASAHLGGLHYQSSVTEVNLPSNRCLGAEEGHQLSRLAACYYAGIVDMRAGGLLYRFLLVDTNDYVDVTSSVYPFAGQVEGTRGAISFRDSAEVRSQTSWFVQTQRGLERPDVLVGSSHYDIPSLRKQVMGFVLSRKSQLLANLFVDPASGDDFFKRGVFFLSAHTHAFANREQQVIITEGGKARIALPELNVGSTTDYPSLSAILRFSERGGTPDDALHLSHEHVRLLNRLPGAFCTRTLAALEARSFQHVDGLPDAGGAAVYLSAENRFTYRDLNGDRPRADAVFERIDSFVGGSDEVAICLGLEAARIEAGEAREINRRVQD